MVAAVVVVQLLLLLLLVEVALALALVGVGRRASQSRRRRRRRRRWRRSHARRLWSRFRRYLLPRARGMRSFSLRQSRPLGSLRARH